MFCENPFNLSESEKEHNGRGLYVPNLSSFRETDQMQLPGFSAKLTLAVSIHFGCSVQGVRRSDVPSLAIAGMKRRSHHLQWISSDAPSFHFCNR